MSNKQSTDVVFSNGSVDKYKRTDTDKDSISKTLDNSSDFISFEYKNRYTC